MVTQDDIDRLKKGLEAGRHTSPPGHTDDDQVHQTVRYPGGTLHYYEERSAWRDFPDEE